MAELKVIYGNTNARDFCVKEEKQSYIQMEMQYISSLSKPFEDKKKRMKIIYERLKIIIKNTLEYIDKAYENGKINIRDYDEMTTIIENINSYFLDMYGKYENIDEEVRNMVKSFYDPKVEERQT